MKCLITIKYIVFGRHSKSNRRTPKEIGIHAVRGGTYVGEHDIIFAGLDEVIEINHRGLSKNVFAEGPIAAARFIVKEDKGLIWYEACIKYIIKNLQGKPVGFFFFFFLLYI